MNWDDLRIFLAVARTGTLSAAGRRLGLDATTVARRLGRLEVEAGRSLFEVTPAGHILTARGQDLLGHAQTMESAAIACAEGAQAGLQASGTIRVSVAEGFGTSVIAPHLHEFADAHPGIGVELVASSGFLNLSRREADVAVMLARPQRGPLVARKLTDYNLGIYGRRGVARPLSSIADLGEERLVGYVPDLIYAPELHYLEETAPGLSATLSSTSVNAQAAMIRSGAGIGILHCFVGDLDPLLERLLPEEVDIARSYWLVMHRDLRGVARVKAFVDWLDGLVTRMRPLMVGRP
ncbi:LysR family transcriptional regulator [Sphingomonas tabacisoli]|uniref:LysR family transcriptional regulator n=1 Tax=Sphingomonas tabacisoli TaxID=2249466 RepID=A0ABW4I5I9_9SPHN